MVLESTVKGCSMVLRRFSNDFQLILKGFRMDFAMVFQLILEGFSIDFLMVSQRVWKELSLTLEGLSMDFEWIWKDTQLIL